MLGIILAIIGGVVFYNLIFPLVDGLNTFLQTILAYWCAVWQQKVNLLTAEEKIRSIGFQLDDEESKADESEEEVE